MIYMIYMNDVMCRNLFIKVIFLLFRVTSVIFFLINHIMTILHLREHFVKGISNLGGLHLKGCALWGTARMIQAHE